MRTAVLALAVTAATAFAGAQPALAADTGSIIGHLTTDAGEPVGSATVNVYTADTWMWVGWATTADDGSYTVADLPAGSYLLEFQPFDRPGQFYDNKTWLDDADPVAVVAGQATTVDEDLNGVGYVTGVLRDADGNALADRSVAVSSVNGGSSNGWTDWEGRYRVAVTAGEYLVSFEPYPGSGQWQYVPGKVFGEDATIFTVVAGQDTVADDTALVAGSISGRLTTADGQPVAGARISLGNREMSGTGPELSTNANGAFSAAAVLPGEYVVRFEKDDRIQFYNGKTSWETANLITVTSGQNTRVVDSWLPTGSVAVSAVDSVTGASIADFCVSDACSAGTGTVTVSGLTVGRHELFLFTVDGSYFERSRIVNARANQTVAVTVKMRPAARISTTVVDAATGAPVAGVCAGAFKPKHVAQPDGFGYCSDATGRLTIGRLTAGTYRLFVDPTEAPRYGRQWLGATGGTGDERQAASVTAAVGEVATAPTVRLDPAGSIAGTVTDGATGVPIEFSSVNLLTSHPGAGLSETSTDEDGHYRIDRLGPYAWPLGFAANGYAGQWSGNAADRYAATPVQVTAGGVATGDIGLVRGVEVRGTVALEDGTPVDGYVATKNAETGDYAGTDYAEDGTYLIRVIAGQRVSYAYDVYAGDRYFSSDRAALPPAEPGGPVRYVVRVPATGLQLNLTVATS